MPGFVAVLTHENAERLHDAALGSDDTDAAFVAGELAESFAAERRHVRRTWWERWRRAKRAHAKAAV